MSPAYSRLTDLLVRSARELSPEELEQLGAKVAAMRELSPGSSQPSRPRPSGDAPSKGEEPGAVLPDIAFPQLLYNAMAEVIHKETGTRQPSYFAFIKTPRSRGFPKAVRAAGEAHASWFPEASRVETAMLVGVYAQCCACFLERRGHPLAWSYVVHVIAKLPEVVNESFPGYARSGVMSVLLRKPVRE